MRDFFIWLASVAIGFWIIGLIFFILHVPTRIVDESTKTDAIVVLTGGALRIQEGLNLLQNGMAPRMFISGVHQAVVLPEILTAKKELSCCVELGYAATNTVQNSWEVRDWVERHKIQSIRLVTSAYHMQRSMLLHQRSLPVGTVIIPHPVLNEEMKDAYWWEDGAAWRRILIEYHKYLFIWLF